MQQPLNLANHRSCSTTLINQLPCTPPPCSRSHGRTHITATTSNTAILNPDRTLATTHNPQLAQYNKGQEQILVYPGHLERYLTRRRLNERRKRWRMSPTWMLLYLKTSKCLQASRHRRGILHSWQLRSPVCSGSRKARHCGRLSP